MHLEGLEHGVCRVPVQVELLPDAAKGGGDAERLAVSHKGHVAQEGLIQDCMHRCLVVYAPLRLALHCGAGYCIILVLTCTSASAFGPLAALRACQHRSRDVNTVRRPSLQAHHEHGVVSMKCCRICTWRQKQVGASKRDLRRQMRGSRRSKEAVGSLVVPTPSAMCVPDTRLHELQDRPARSELIAILGTRKFQRLHSKRMRMHLSKDYERQRS